MTRWMLLAEDNALDADLLLRGMSADQAREHVIVAQDGVEALDCLYRRARFESRDAGNPAVILLDLKMPKMGGLEVLRQIRSDPGLKCIPVVILTSSREEKDVTRCYQFGTNAYIVKPVDIHQFLSVASELWRHWMDMNEPPPIQCDTAVPQPVHSPAGP